MAEKALGESATGDQDTMRLPTPEENMNLEHIHPATQGCISWMTLKKRLDGPVETRLSIADLKELIRHNDGPMWESYKTSLNQAIRARFVTAAERLGFLHHLLGSGFLFQQGEEYTMWAVDIILEPLEHLQIAPELDAEPRCKTTQTDGVAVFGLTKLLKRQDIFVGRILPIIERHMSEGLFAVQIMALLIESTDLPFLDTGEVQDEIASILEQMSYNFLAPGKAVPEPSLRKRKWPEWHSEDSANAIGCILDYAGEELDSSATVTILEKIAHGSTQAIPGEEYGEAYLPITKILLDFLDEPCDPPIVADTLASTITTILENLPEKYIQAFIDVDSVCWVEWSSRYHEAYGAMQSMDQRLLKRALGTEYERITDLWSLDLVYLKKRRLRADIQASKVERPVKRRKIEVIDLCDD